ncbi:hypothetical protein OYC64_015371 [Pagothenia borchgrevinki]|uniref:Uncharacterized protein n=1 Tax=Pagothenia borchgrevinki TaxID=8213 RepID=A0ABD2HG82_PAGBO
MASIGSVAAAVAIGEAIAGALPTHRQCDIKIVNECTTYTLCNPRTYTSSGSCATPLPPTVAPLKSGNAVFKKTPHAATGTVGVFTYDLLNNRTNRTAEKIAVMFSVPYDFNLYSNWYAVGVFNKSKECDYDLYCEMYYNTDITFVRGKASGNNVLTCNGKQVTIMATMSDGFQTVMKVRVKQN